MRSNTQNPCILVYVHFICECKQVGYRHIQASGDVKLAIPQSWLCMNAHSLLYRVLGAGQGIIVKEFSHLQYVSNLAFNLH